MEGGRGFSLIELLILLALITIFVSTGIPAVNRYHQKQQANAIEAKLFRTFQSARQQAIATQRPLHMCGSDDGIQCSKLWSGYILIFQDSDMDSAPNPSEIIEAHRFSLTNGQIKTRISFGKKAAVLTPKGTSTLTGSFIYCPGDEASGLYRRLTWNRVGRPYVGRDRNGDGSVDDTDGSPLTCT